MHHRQSDFFDVDVDVEVADAKHLTGIAAALRACPSSRPWSERGAEAGRGDRLGGFASR
jgi:hypothetical protein